MAIDCVRTENRVKYRSSVYQPLKGISKETPVNIVAIGGGELRLEQTLPIDRFIVDLTGKPQPNALFLPTASQDSAGYCETFRNVYGKTLGCQVEFLCLSQPRLTKEDIEQRIANADLVYVGGGNTRLMMQRWHETGVDHLLLEAGQRGCVLSGLSAGAICWFQAGLSDSDAFNDEADWSFASVAGLNLTPEIFCPHVDSEQRHQPFTELVRNTDAVGLGADDGAAVWIHDNRYLALSCLPNAAVGLYRSSKQGLDYQRYGDGQKLPLGESA
nr:Type 1 glutamine amidotransferase-like domain-containing protein [Reinekea sp. G2M2-21]